MDKIIKQLKEHKYIILIVLIIILGFQACSKGRAVSRLNKNIVKINKKLDSLEKLVPSDTTLILNSITTKIYVYDDINNEMSKLDRHKQMMEFQKEHIIKKIESLKDSSLKYKK